MFRNISAITFKVGTYCDLDCEYCFQKHDVKTKSNTFNIYDDLIKFLSNPLITFADRLEIKVTGGEPSLYTDEIREAYKKLKKLERVKDTKLYFTSIFNGTRMEEMISLMDDGILDPYGCKISWDGIYSSTKSRFSKIEKYDDEYFRNVIRALGKSKYANDVLVRIALTPNTISDMVESFKFALDAGCKKIEYYYLTDCDTYNLKSFQSKFIDAFGGIAQLKQEYDFNWANWETLEISSLLDEKEDRLRAINCRHLGKMLYIEQNGDIAPCGFFSSDAIFDGCNYYIGNIYRGFYKDKIKKFIKVYSKAPMCNRTECKNLQCFECPATNFYRNKEMQNKLYQTCVERHLERILYDRYKSQIPSTIDKSKKAYSYINDWSVSYDIPELPYYDI